MAGESYEGWSTWETWNINLWIDNEEPSYKAKIRLINRGELESEDVENFCKEWFPAGTPDFDSKEDYNKVDWEELAEEWNNERGT